MKILIAEDDTMLREMLDSFLSDLGHSVKSAENGAELVKLALDDKPDLIVTDLQMPEMAGNSMIAMLDMYPPLAGIPVIMVTGASQGEIADVGIPSEIPILSKPVDFNRLTEEINRIAGRQPS
ncbi:MAG TPA: response regulator [Elusimicrobiales bacterium]|nr:response regulator [Elusimicrobiales bacterium]